MGKSREIPSLVDASNSLISQVWVRLKLSARHSTPSSRSVTGQGQITGFSPKSCTGIFITWGPREEAQGQLRPSPGAGLLVCRQRPCLGLGTELGTCRCVTTSRHLASLPQLKATDRICCVEGRHSKGLDCPWPQGGSRPACLLWGAGSGTQQTQNGQWHCCLSGRSAQRWRNVWHWAPRWLPKATQPGTHTHLWAAPQVAHALDPATTSG